MAVEHPILPGPDISPPAAPGRARAPVGAPRRLGDPPEVVTCLLSFSFLNRRVLSTNPYVGSTSNGYAHPSGAALHYDDVPCTSGSVSVAGRRGSILSLSWEAAPVAPCGFPCLNERGRMKTTPTSLVFDTPFALIHA